VQLVYAIIAVVVATVVASVVTNKVTISKLKNDADSKLGNAEAKAREIIDDAIKTA
jgi:ribonuclease Y